MYRLLVLLLLVAACADTTEPDLRSVRAPEGAGKPVYADYELTLYLTDGSVYAVDTLHVEPDGRVSRWTGDLHTVLHPGDLFEPTWPYLPGLPLTRGEVIATQFRQLNETTWWTGPTIGDPCVRYEELFRNAAEPWSPRWNCVELREVRSIWLSGSVKPNGTATGEFLAILGIDEPVGTFTLVPIRGRPLTWPAEPVVTYTLVPADTALVYPQPDFRFMPAGYVLVYGSDGYYVARTTTEHLSYTVPDGCVQVDDDWVECSGDVPLPLTMVVTVLPDAEWYTFNPFGLVPISTYIDVGDFSGQQVIVTVKSELTE